MRRAPLLLAVVALLAGCVSGDATPAPKPACPTEPPTAISAQATLADAGFATVTVAGAVEGKFGLELYGADAPIATANFVALARCGFYDRIKFHRVLAGFVIQAGDPNTRTQDGDFSGIGRGGAGYEFEIEPPADRLDYGQYSVSMANDTRANDSQFFVALDDLNRGLPRSYTIFGQVVSGMDIVDEIAAVPVNDPRVGIPATPVWIASIEISDSSGIVPSPGS
ncbi:MAG: peptidylprolyl isomerase [Candidatus Limnocylindria bacterium]